MGMKGRESGEANIRKGVAKVERRRNRRTAREEARAALAEWLEERYEEGLMDSYIQRVKSA